MKREPKEIWVVWNEENWETYSFRRKEDAEDMAKQQNKRYADNKEHWFVKGFIQTAA